jgi:hypothetical protein
MSGSKVSPEAPPLKLQADAEGIAPDFLAANPTAFDKGGLLDLVIDPSASELAQGLASIVHAFPPEAIEDLERLISNELGAPTSAELREARLGLLIELISTGDGEIPRTRDYDGVRKLRAQTRDEEWPAASTIVESYGSFLAAVKAAMRLHHEGSAARVPHTHRHARPYKRYSRNEVVAAIRSFRDQHGSWPRSELEYLTWATTVRRIKRNGGHPDPRLPSAKPIRTLFGGFQRALDITKEGDP